MHGGGETLRARSCRCAEQLLVFIKSDRVLLEMKGKAVFALMGLALPLPRRGWLAQPQTFLLRLLLPGPAAAWQGHQQLPSFPPEEH